MTNHDFSECSFLNVRFIELDSIVTKQRLAIDGKHVKNVQTLSFIFCYTLLTKTVVGISKSVKRPSKCRFLVVNSTGFVLCIVTIGDTATIA